MRAAARRARSGVDAVARVRACDHDGPARLHRPRRGSRGAGRRTPARDERRAVRRSSRPPGAPVRGADEADLPGVHEQQRPGKPLLGSSVHRLPRLPGRCSSTATTCSRRLTPSRSPGTERSRTCRSGWDEGFVRGMTSERPHDAVMAIAISVAPSQQGRRLLEPDDPDVHGQRASGGPFERRDRARATDVEGALPAHSDRALHATGAARTGRTSTRGSGSTSSSAGRSSPPRRGRWRSRAPARRLGRSGRACAFPSDGEYVFPGGLATLVVEDGIGTHVEPNVWVLHRV